jgi:3-deoxy-D-manno-octulosonic-acid transferase
MPWGERIYELAAAAAAMLLPAVSRVHPKLARAAAGWRGASAALQAWGREARDPERPVVWVHAPSVGEALMAQAIIDALRRARPGVQIVFTHFSASAERIARGVGADVATYLPLERRHEIGRVLGAISPAVVAFVRTEVWPLLSREAVRHGATLALVNGVLGRDSGRASRSGRFLLGAAYRRLSVVGAVSEADARAFGRLVDPARVRVTGDARFDQVWARVAAAADGGPANLLAVDGVPLIVAGSTWEEDERRLVPAVASAGHSRPLRLVIAPHEPTPAHLEGLAARLAQAGLESRRLSDIEEAGGWRQAARTTVVIIDRVGVLADAYRGAALAYVGGGFGAAGLHSVVEPAALGVPVLFGPGVGHASEAFELAAAGGGSVVLDMGSLRSRLERWLADEPTRAAAGAAAREYVRGRLGGAVANAALLCELLDASPVMAAPAVSG